MEIWKDIQGYKGLYQISNLGRVKSLDRIVVRKNKRVCNHSGRIMRKCNETQHFTWNELGMFCDMLKDLSESEKDLAKARHLMAGHHVEQGSL